MTIAPGIYALHRAGEAVRPHILHDDALGFRVEAGFGPIKAAPQDGVTTIALTGSLHAAGLGVIAIGEGLVTQGSPAVEPAGPGAGWLAISCKGAAVPDGPVGLRAAAHPTLPPCDPTPADVLLSATPTQHDLTLFKDQDRNFGAGFWETTAYHRRAIPFPKFEVMHMLSGWIELTVDDGQTHRFDAGDTFLIAKGTRCDWRTGGMKKLFCTFVPER